VSYAVALANGTSDGGASETDVNNDKEIAARLILSPFKLTNHEALRGFSGGAAVTYGHQEGTGALPTLRSPGQASIFSYSSGVFADGPRTRFSPQLSWYYGPLGVLSEYVVSNQELVRGVFQDKFENRAWQIAGTYVLTGEDATSKGVTPLKDFNPAAGTWGAWELAARYHELDVDDSIFTQYANGTFANAASAVSEAESWAVGTNWHLNRNVRLQFNFEHTEFNGGNWADGAFADRPDENAVLSRFQIAY
jgi:phosphate-selective porin OprO/OprP